MLHNSLFCILKRDSFPRPCCHCRCFSFEEQLNCSLSLRNCWTVEQLRNSCHKLWPGLPSASITNVTSTPLLTLGGFSYERFPQVLTTLKDLGWARFDLPAHKKICFQVQVCKHPEGELALKSKEATPFPEYLKYSQVSLSSSSSMGSFCQTWFSFTRSPEGAWSGAAGFYFSTLQRNSIISPPYVTLWGE